MNLRLTSSPRKVAVIADDLTGAADAAVAFAVRGARVSVPLSGRPGEDVDVLALLSDSRWRTPAEGADLVSRLVSRARAWGADTLFVKVDSTLRGNVHAEVEAAITAWGAEGLGSPAFPAQGRVVREGVLFVHGDPQSGRVAEAFPSGVTVQDATSDEDLDQIAERALNEGLVAVGSAGLARALAGLMLSPASRIRGPRGPVTGVLAVVGTAHPATLAQMAPLSATCSARLVVTEESPVRIDDAVSALSGGARVLVATDVAHAVEQDSVGALALVEKLAGVIRVISDAVPRAGLVLTGGATALAVATALEATEFRLLSETRPGVVVGELQVPDRSIPTITKSGGFGAQDALLDAVTTLEACA